MLLQMLPFALVSFSHIAQACKRGDTSASNIPGYFGLIACSCTGTVIKAATGNSPTHWAWAFLSMTHCDMSSAQQTNHNHGNCTLLHVDHKHFIFIFWMHQCRRFVILSLT